MQVLALDLSLTATGVAYPDATTTTWSPKNLNGPARLKWFRQKLDDILEGFTYGPLDLVVIEEYAFAAKGAHAHEVGELGGVVRLTLHDRGQAWTAVNPKSLKRYATGNGNANKDLVRDAARDRLGPLAPGISSDECDALWLRAMALDHYGEPVVQMPASNRQSLAAVAWPELAVADA